MLGMKEIYEMKLVHAQATEILRLLCEKIGFLVDYRQSEVFSLIHGYCSRDGVAARIDAEGNTMLHVVANLAPSSKLNRISGPAFQMQSELQWFKLRDDGEKWMKETASSCSVVGALVVTIMFAAAFTVPGGNNQFGSYSWVYLPIVMLASVPVTLFVLLQFPLLVRMISSTYGPGIFKRNAEPWL
ncbi:ankyrin repeat-containing protein NPR4-like [Senna tora]|uniref:Ankyrin repeat-containing protein NPR4-like n=1 Tax=Senna tora TaxID=362788 RepID=A0A834WFB6_9FABA|nr:ankyrin repeat-containing protein NPR4-like [Senna tora]